MLAMDNDAFDYSLIRANGYVLIDTGGLFAPGRNIICN